TRFSICTDSNLGEFALPLEVPNVMNIDELASQEANEDPNINISQPGSFLNLEVNIEWQELRKESLKMVFENLNSSTTVESLRQSIIERL
ncbi:MAG: hypothetical protein MHPSP_003509, partial [Paramarteilia canceri]